jgi:hypothetical protein
VDESRLIEGYPYFLLGIHEAAVPVIITLVFLERVGESATDSRYLFRYVPALTEERDPAEGEPFILSAAELADLLSLPELASRLAKFA